MWFRLKPFRLKRLSKLIKLYLWSQGDITNKDLPLLTTHTNNSTSADGNKEGCTCALDSKEFLRLTLFAVLYIFRWHHGFVTRTTPRNWKLGKRPRQFSRDLVSKVHRLLCRIKGRICVQMSQVCPGPGNGHWCCYFTFFAQKIIQKDAFLIWLFPITLSSRSLQGDCQGTPAVRKTKIVARNF